MSDIVMGSGNVFADLGIPDADAHLLKAGLAIRLHAEIRASGATLEAAAERLDIVPRDLALIVEGHFRGVSVERIVGLLVGMGVDVSIVLGSPPEGAEAGSRVLHGVEAAPEFVPAAGRLRYRPEEYDDWGMIRDRDGTLFAVVRRPCSQEEEAEHRSAGTDPFEDLARLLMEAEELRRGAAGETRARALAKRIVEALSEQPYQEPTPDRDAIEKRYGELRTTDPGGFREAASRARLEFVEKLLSGRDPHSDDRTTISDPSGTSIRES